MIRLFEGFSGYGSQKLAFNRLDISVESVGISEIDPDAIIAYAALHCDESEYIDEGLNIETKRQILMDCNVGYDFKEGKSKIPRMEKVKLEQLFKAHILSKNKGDISLLQIDDLPDMNFFTYSFPCTDISVAGKQEGLEKGSGTRSSLLWECEKVITGKRPEYLMMENVKNLVGKNHKEDFDIWLGILDGLGYNNYWKVINAKDCGVPQNRERVFCVSIRRDVDEGTFRFNEPFDNGVRLKDLLEEEVDEKYYIGSEKVEKLLRQLDYKNIDKVCCDMTINQPKFRDIGNCIKARYDAGISNQRSEGIGVVVPSILRPERTEYGKAVRKQYENGEIKESRHNMTELKPRKDGISNTLTTVQKDNLLIVPCLTPDRIEKRQNGRRFKENGEPMFTLTGQDRHGVLINEINQIGNIVETESFGGNPQRGRIYGTNGLSPSLNTVGGGGLEPKILTIPPQEMQGGGRQPHVLCLNSKDGNGKQPPQSQRVYDENGLMVTIDVGTNGRFNVLTNYRIRKLTPKECFRLMGLNDKEIKKIQDAGISNSQQYKMAGNSIVVDQMFFLKNLF